MLQWNDMHPYNAVHLARIPEKLELDRLGEAINCILGNYGLAGLTINRGQGTYRYSGGRADWEIRIAGETQKEIERQLNTPFARAGSFNPLRFFVVAARDSFWLGLAYFHAIADAESVVFLMQRLIRFYMKSAASDASFQIDLYPRGYRSLLRQPRLLGKKIAALPSSIRDMNNSYRPGYREDAQNAFAFFCLSAEELNSLIATGKSWEVTLNDLFLALLLVCLSPIAKERWNAERKKMSIGCVIDTRSDLMVESARTFGLFLGSFVITHGVPAEISLVDLAKAIRRQTQAIKKDRAYLGGSLGMVFSRFMLALLSTKRRKKLYQTHFPLWAGVTNMNLNRIWDLRQEEKPLDYFRAVSTGPITPLVMSITTARDAVNIGLSYKPSIIPAAVVEEMKACFVSRVQGMKTIA